MLLIMDSSFRTLKAKPLPVPTHPPSKGSSAWLVPVAPFRRGSQHHTLAEAPNSLTVPSLLRVSFNSIYIKVLLENVIFEKS